MTGAELIAAERQRQIDAEGWTPDHDDMHGTGQLYQAGICYLTAGDCPSPGRWPTPPGLWPWERRWWKPRSEIRNLVRGAALLLAEKERYERHGWAVPPVLAFLLRGATALLDDLEQGGVE